MLKVLFWESGEIGLLEQPKTTIAVVRNPKMAITTKLTQPVFPLHSQILGLIVSRQAKQYMVYLEPTYKSPHQLELPFHPSGGDSRIRQSVQQFEPVRFVRDSKVEQLEKYAGLKSFAITRNN